MSSDLDHPTLGPLAYNPQFGWYSTQVMVGGQEVGVHLLCEGSDGEAPALDPAARLVSMLDAVVSAAKQHAATGLLTLKNDAWLEDDEPEVTRDAFIDRMELSSVIVNGGGTSDLYFRDGDLFWGHVIIVERNEAGEFGEAHIAG